MRDGFTRAREIEDAASDLVAWCDEFVGSVRDNHENCVTPDWLELHMALRRALRPLKEDDK